MVHINLLKSLEPGSRYSLYWVWNWPTPLTGSGNAYGKLEIYTTCLDVMIHENKEGKRARVDTFYVFREFIKAALSLRYALDPMYQ